jgi:hypothetical protein
MPLWRWRWDSGCLTCPPDGLVSYLWVERDALLVSGGELRDLSESVLANAALHAEGVQWLAVDAVTQRANRLPDFVGLASDGTRVMGALGLAGDGQLRTEQEVDFKMRGDGGHLRPEPRAEFAALYVASGSTPGMLVLGGVDEQGTARRDLWRFDFKQGLWSQLASELPAELAQPLAATYDIGQRLLYVAARTEAGNRVFTLDLGCSKPRVSEVEGLGAWVGEADALELALTPDGRLVIGASRRDEESWAIAVRSWCGKLDEPARGEGILAGGLRALDDGVAFTLLADEPKASFLPYSGLLPQY